MLLKKTSSGEMLIEQIIEFELRGSGPLCRTCTRTPATRYFHDKTKISKKNFRVFSHLLWQVNLVREVFSEATCMYSHKKVCSFSTAFLVSITTLTKWPLLDDILHVFGAFERTKFLRFKNHLKKLNHSAQPLIFSFWSSPNHALKLKLKVD